MLLSTLNRRREYMQKGDNRVAKFMARYDGPYKVKHAYPETSTYTLDLPPSMKIFPTFHASMLKRYIRNDDEVFPSRRLERPAPIVMADGVEEWFVDRILNHRRRGRGYQWLVRWKGYGADMDTWEPTWVVKDLAALDNWLKENDIEGNDIAYINTNVQPCFEELYGEFLIHQDLTRSQAPLCPAPSEPDSEASYCDPTPSKESDQGVL